MTKYEFKKLTKPLAADDSKYEFFKVRYLGSNRNVYRLHFTYGDSMRLILEYNAVATPEVISIEQDEESGQIYVIDSAENLAGLVTKLMAKKTN